MTVKTVLDCIFGERCVCQLQEIGKKKRFWVRCLSEESNEN